MVVQIVGPVRLEEDKMFVGRLDEVVVVERIAETGAEREGQLKLAEAGLDDRNLAVEGQIAHLV